MRGECSWENFLPSGHTTYGTTETYHSLKLLLLMIGANEIRGRTGSGSQGPLIFTFVRCIRYKTLREHGGS